MGLTLRSRSRRRGGFRCKDLDCPLCGERNRIQQLKVERRKQERRLAMHHGWNWLKSFLGIGSEDK